MVRALRLSKSLVGSYTGVYSGVRGSVVHQTRNPQQTTQVRNASSLRVGDVVVKNGKKYVMTRRGLIQEAPFNEHYAWELVLQNPALMKRVIYNYIKGKKINAPEDIMVKIRTLANAYLEHLAQQIMNGENPNIPDWLRKKADEYILTQPKTQGKEHTPVYSGVVSHKVGNLPT